MSTTLSTRRQQPTTSFTTSKRSSATSTTTSQATPTSSIVDRQFSLDTSSSTFSATTNTSNNVIGATPTSTPSAKCSADSDCGSNKICSKGVCARVIDGAPFGPAGGSTSGSTSHMSSGAATGLGLGVLSFILILFGLGIWLWRRRVQKIPSFTIESSRVNRSRSVSSATDQKTLVASVPNSPQYANFREQYDLEHTASLAQLVLPHKVASHHRFEKDGAADEEQNSSTVTTRQRSQSTQKRLPLPPKDMPLPPPPTTTEKKYTVNVNINKSMIFDDVMYKMASTPRDTGTPRESETPRDRTKYRFEEYHPPVKITPPISLSSDKRKSEIELAPYPRNTRVSTAPTVSDEGEDGERSLKRKSTLKRLQSRPPQLHLPGLSSPPSPSLSFKSYDWYQDIIGTEQTNLEDTVLTTSAPSIPDRSPRRSPTRPNFIAIPPSTLSEPPIPDRHPHRDLERGLLPAPLSPRPLTPSSPSLLSPSTAATPSPTSTNFILAPAVYVMPSKPARVSLHSSMSQKPHKPRKSWLPAEGLYLPKEGTQDSYTMFKRRISDDSRPTSYSPF
ncbi:hypothetical protein HBH98_202870 [Parastagonospora nodorum]|nr:hypothetical protein HBH51_205500 [Parastagonospora nodorum]KAH4339705.1 hypothetical protein HBH98_202870 [Parastagonospora nodorum]KAH4358955.1 hypothetical protein HBH97_214830 [Parastagonospora nodorum]KAH4383123.1 hypothetical protein HBH99_187300 [Parastagonospora nodorum]KAH4913176.1 hypothetical protein HBH74_165390 [Parastagonospora nodorum]